MKLKKTDHVALGFVGDGGTSEGDFHEALTFAGVFDLPAIFVITNNQWAISHPRTMQTRAKTLAQKAGGYGIDGIQVDGNDILSVHVATEEAVEKARSGGGPTLIEAVTYRLGVHTTADDPKKYRSDEEVAKWEKLDPIPRFRKYLEKKGVLDEDSIAEIDREEVQKVADAVKRSTQRGGAEILCPPRSQSPITIRQTGDKIRQLTSSHNSHRRSGHLPLQAVWFRHDG